MHAEYPVDIDDENISERGFQSTLPGEYTRVSSALALFRLSRLMSKVLEEIYPAAPYHDISLQRVGSLNSELDEWLEGLPAHLRLHFVQDKPSTDVTGSRSPLLVCGSIDDLILAANIFRSHSGIITFELSFIALLLALVLVTKLPRQSSLLLNLVNTLSKSYSYFKNAK